MKFSFLNLFCGLILLSRYSSAYKVKEYTTQEFVVKVNKEDWGVVHHELNTLGACFKKKLLTDFYLFEDNRQMDYESTDIIATEIAANRILNEKIKHYERVREYTVETDGEREEASAVSHDTTLPMPPIANCPTFSDMGVEEAWKMGYSGKGVVIAVTDVGINTDIPDIHKNINTELSYNFVDENRNITPEFCHFNRQSDHGNNCAGVIGAERRNGICGDGIVYNADLVGIKLASVQEHVHHEACWASFMTTWTSQGLLHAHDIVDVYSNSWGSNKDFIYRSQLMADTLHTGAKTGRHGKGAVYVFPVDHLADPYANDKHTIAVNSIGATGYASSFSNVCACTLTVGYGECYKDRTIVLHTTSYLRRSKCTADFQGTSATTAVVSGIIGLALEANPNLTWRDIQDLVVQASEAWPLPEYNYFSINGAGKRYHPILGFGLLNAAKLVRLAEKTTGLQEQIQTLGRCSNIVSRGRKRNKNHYQYPYSEATVDIKCVDTCINRTESVLLNISYDSPSEYHTELILTSPQGTLSLLMDSKQSEYKGSTSRRNVFLQSVNFWGEAAKGSWTITLKQTDYKDIILIISCEITIYGTGHSTPTTSTVEDKHMSVDESKQHEATQISSNSNGFTKQNQIVQHHITIGLGLKIGIAAAVTISIAFGIIRLCVYLICCKQSPGWFGIHLRMCLARIWHLLPELRIRGASQEMHQPLSDEYSLTELSET